MSHDRGNTVDAINFVGRLLDAYAVDACRMGCAQEDPADGGVPPEMQVGTANAEGWVEWRVLPSSLEEAELAAFEAEFGVELPPVFRAYLLARFHLFHQVHSRRHDQLVLITDTPAGAPLQPLRDMFEAWQPLTAAGLIPFADWGDGWGPMCFDAGQRQRDGDCPVVWLDHEALVSLGPNNCRQRELVLSVAQPLYDSGRAFLLDVFERD